MIQPPLPLLLCLLVCGALLVVSPAAAISLSPGSTFSGAPVIANGDSVFIHGIATGHPREGLQVWLLGSNYVKISSVSASADNSYEYELTPAATRSLAPGQYFVLVQHSMMNGQFDIAYNAASGSVINRQLGQGTSIFQLTRAGSLQTTDSANSLMQAISSQNLDDTFALTSFIINPPAAFINPVGDHRVGAKFIINGSTNLAAGDALRIEVTSSSFKPTTKFQNAEFSGAAGTVTVVAGTGGLNRWSFPVDASTFKPDEYIVKVSGITIDVSGSTLFNIVESLPVTPPPLSTVTTELILPSTITTPPAPLPTTRQSPLSMIGIIGSVALMALATMNWRK